MSKMLSQIMPEINIQSAADDVEIFGVTDDSRKVQSGYLYIAVDGANFKAKGFIPEVVEQGAGAIVAETENQISGLKLPAYALSELGKLRGVIASRFLDSPSSQMTVVAVTGTNGKTSCSQYISQALTSVGLTCGVIGTTGTGFPDELKDAGLTTPDAITLQENLKLLLDAGARVVSIEASSHGLDQGRLNGVAVNVAVFTNLTRDHLDYHGSIEGYGNAKKALFAMPGLEFAVVNIDDEFGQTILQYLDQINDQAAQSVTALTYSVNNKQASVHCLSVDYEPAGFAAEIQTPWGRASIKCDLLGAFNVSNVLAVIAVLGSQGLTIDQITQAVSSLKNVTGRMDVLPLPNGAFAVIDYAHTPDALKNALEALREHSDGKIYCVMGCGGDRDKGKRPEMGAVACELADQVIITDDNPRMETSSTIIDGILAGVSDLSSVQVIADRKQAIAEVLQQAVAGDLVLIAGKGHEPYQDVGGVKLPYSDYEEVSNFVSVYRDQKEA